MRKIKTFCPYCGASINSSDAICKECNRTLKSYIVRHKLVALCTVATMTVFMLSATYFYLMMQSDSYAEEGAENINTLQGLGVETSETSNETVDNISDEAINSEENEEIMPESKTVKPAEKEIIYNDTEEGDYYNDSCPPDDENITTGLLQEGTYKVGVDVPAGEYKATKLASSIRGIIIVTDTPNWENSRETFPKLFENTAYFEVKDGQYLVIEQCYAEKVN